MLSKAVTYSSTSLFLHPTSALIFSRVALLKSQERRTQAQQGSQEVETLYVFLEMPRTLSAM